MVAVLKPTSNESAFASTSEDTSAVQTQSVPEGDFPETTEKIRQCVEQLRKQWLTQTHCSSRNING